MVGMPCRSLTASWHCTAAMIDAIVGVVGVFPCFHFRTAQQIARPPGLQKFPIGLRHRAFVARPVAGEKNPRGAGDGLDGAVDPGAIDLVAMAIDREAGLAIIQPGDDNIRPSECAHAQVVNHIAVESVSVDFGINGAWRPRRRRRP